MKSTMLFFLTIAIITIFSLPIHAGLRCQNDLISVDDTTSEVRQRLSKCGEVLDKETVKKETIVKVGAKTDGETVKKQTVTEIWYIRVKERGGMYCYPLSFEEGRLIDIGRWSRCD